MDTDDFLRRCDEIEKGLRKISNGLYASIQHDGPGDERNELIAQAKRKINQYEEFHSMLEDDEEREELDSIVLRYIDSMKNNLKKV